MQLNDYITNVRDKLRDAGANFYTTAELTRWINRARKQVAKDGQCVRILPPSTASIATITVTSGGAGYTSTPKVEISAPDGATLLTTQATGAASISAGAVTTIAVVVAGAGYVADPTVTITGGGGAGATAMATLTPLVRTTANQERYLFSDISSVIAATTAGAGDVLGIQSVAVAQAFLKPILDYLPFSDMQAYLRAYPYYQTWPTVWSQYGQGVLGSLYVWPVPAQPTQMDVDCLCSVQDLSVSQTVDLIPEPWTEAVFYYAAGLAQEMAQRPDSSRAMMAICQQKMLEARAATTPPRVPSFYG